MGQNGFCAGDGGEGGGLGGGFEWHGGCEEQRVSQ